MLPKPLRNAYASFARLAAGITHDILGLLARVSVGAVFLKSGLTKVASFTSFPFGLDDDGVWSSTLFLFREEYKVPLMPPELSAYMATAAELWLSILLILGVFSRLTALPFLGMTLVIQVFVYPMAWVEHLTWAVLLLYIVARGPGRFSVDGILGPKT